MAQNYQDLVSIVEEMEKNSAKVDFNAVDISSIQSPKVKKRKPPFRPLLDLAIEIESGRSADSVKRAGRMQPQRITQPKEPEQRPKQNKSTKDEIGAFANKLNKNREQKQQISGFNVKESEEDLQLPKLSVSDQISELEQMIDGLKSRTFDYEHIETIKKEVYGLDKYMIREIMKGSKKKLTQMEQNLITLRDQRLNEAMKILGDSK